MPLLEKAYAKLDQNYDRLAGGNGNEGMRTITGMPTNLLNNRGAVSGKEMYHIHKWLASHDYPMTAACCVGGSVDGLISGHAYALLDVHDVTLANGQKTTLAKLRNPWGREHYKGPWSDSSSEWKHNPGVKSQVHYVDANDGIFYMPYKLFIQKYYYTAFTVYNEKFKVQKMTKTFKKSRTMIRFHNPVAQEVYVTGDMYSGRNFPRGGKCKPKNSLVIMLTNTHWKQTSTQRYTWLG